jgi:hypothetical protein
MTRAERFRQLLILEYEQLARGARLQAKMDRWSIETYVYTDTKLQAVQRSEQRALNDAADYESAAALMKGESNGSINVRPTKVPVGMFGPELDSTKQRATGCIPFL